MLISGDAYQGEMTERFLYAVYALCSLSCSSSAACPTKSTNIVMEVGTIARATRSPRASVHSFCKLELILSSFIFLLQEENEVEIEIENAYYEGDDCKTENPAKSVALFEKVISLEEDSGLEVKWRFKALEHLVVLQFRLGFHDNMLHRYNQVLPGCVECVYF